MTAKSGLFGDGRVHRSPSSPLSDGRGDTTAFLLQVCPEAETLGLRFDFVRKF
jgi:hypothetical protein